MDQYVDAWDVHAYPQRPPTLGGTLSNSPNETEQGVLTCYERIGRTNTKPFWIGETGARASHGYVARRWQADMVAKMTACACSRDDFQFIAFLWPWHDAHTGTHAGPKAGANDITTPHMPGEAAYYTASALIDGFPYSRLDLGDENVQAGLFGETRMLWTTGPPAADQRSTAGCRSVGDRRCRGPRSGACRGRWRSSNDRPDGQSRLCAAQGEL